MPILTEVYQELKIGGIQEVYLAFIEIAKRWKTVSDLFYKAGETEDLKYINEASEILIDLSELERKPMAQLQKELK